MTDVTDATITAVTTLLAVGLGAGLSRGGRNTDWRRDRRTDSYAALLLAAHELHQRLIRASLSPEPHAPLDDDDVFRLSEDMRSAATSCELFGGFAVVAATRDLLDVPFQWVDAAPDELQLADLERAIEVVRGAMRAELDPGPRNPLTLRALRHRR